MRNLGLHVYGLAAAALGAIALAWGDFALVWQPVPADLPGRTILAYVTGALLLLAGLAVNWKRTARYGAAVLTVLFMLDVLLLHGPLVAARPFNLGVWGGVGEQLALAAGGAIAYASVTGSQDIARIGRIAFGLCLLVFGAEHFRYAAETSAMVPKWLPPGGIFWAYATGAAHVAAGLAILSGIQARLAAVLLTAMFAIFAVLVHAPLLLAGAPSHLHWVMNAMNLALTGAAWVVADSLRPQPR